MPGPLRMGLHNLLISVHLEAHAKSRLMTQGEYIIPLAAAAEGAECKAIELFREGADDDPTAKIRETVPLLERSVSVRPTINIEELKYVITTSQIHIYYVIVYTL